MSHASPRRKLALLLLLAFFAAPWATMAGERAGSHRPPQSAAVEPWDLAGRLWRLLSRVWSATGCHIDPSGRCIPDTGTAPAATPQGDEGCNIDPGGRCVS
jgi:hypothetical protein